MDNPSRLPAVVRPTAPTGTLGSHPKNAARLCRKKEEKEVEQATGKIHNENGNQTEPTNPVLIVEALVHHPGKLIDMLPASLEPIQLHISAPLLPGVILIKASPCTPLHVLCRPAMSASTSRTSFSSFKSPRSPPTPPGSSMPFMRRKMLSESCISMKGMHFDGDDLRHDPRGWAIPPKHVRNGYVGIQRDSLRSWAWTRKVWLVLDDKWLYTCQREGTASTHALQLRQVRRLEKVEGKQHCLAVGTSLQTWYLLFRDTVSLHTWFYDIRVQCPLMQIGKPTDFRHEMHVSYDAAASEIKGLPESWIQTFASWGLGPRLDYSASPVESQLTSPMTEPTTSPLSSGTSDSFDSAGPLVPPRLPVRQRSVSAAVAPSSAASVAPSVDLFRKSPNRFRDVNARDLTGAVQPVHLLPTSRTETCDIWKAEWVGSFGKRKVAIQVVRCSGLVPEEEQTRLGSIVWKEVNVLHQLRHTNVVRIRGFCRDQGPLPAVISTWLPRGNINDYLRYHRPVVAKETRLKFLTEVASGVNYLHNFSRTIVHGNLCGSNILLSDRGAACISGFGLNPILQALETSCTDPFVTTSTYPSPRWAAMEVIHMGRRHLTHSSDVFSFARTVVEVMTGKEPFHYITDDVEVCHTVIRGVLPRRPIVFGEGDGLWPFLERCWSEDPSQRPSMALALLRMEQIHLFYQDREKEPPVSS